MIIKAVIGLAAISDDNTVLYDRLHQDNLRFARIGKEIKRLTQIYNN